jgi:hypothetical protein
MKIQLIICHVVQASAFSSPSSPRWRFSKLQVKLTFVFLYNKFFPCMVSYKIYMGTVPVRKQIFFQVFFVLSMPLNKVKSVQIVAVLLYKTGFITAEVTAVGCEKYIA